jgi:hypothetical protein
MRNPTLLFMTLTLAILNLNLIIIQVAGACNSPVLATTCDATLGSTTIRAYECFDNNGYRCGPCRIPANDIVPPREACTCTNNSNCAHNGAAISHCTCINPIPLTCKLIVATKCNGTSGISTSTLQCNKVENCQCPIQNYIPIVTTSTCSCTNNNNCVRNNTVIPHCTCFDPLPPLCRSISVTTCNATSGVSLTSIQCDNDGDCRCPPEPQMIIVGACSCTNNGNCRHSNDNTAIPHCTCVDIPPPPCSHTLHCNCDVSSGQTVTGTSYITDVCSPSNCSPCVTPYVASATVNITKSTIGVFSDFIIRGTCSCVGRRCRTTSGPSLTCTRVTTFPSVAADFVVDPPANSAVDPPADPPGNSTSNCTAVEVTTCDSRTHRATSKFVCQRPDGTSCSTCPTPEILIVQQLRTTIVIVDRRCACSSDSNCTVEDVATNCTCTNVPLACSPGNFWECRRVNSTYSQATYVKQCRDVDGRPCTGCIQSDIAYPSTSCNQFTNGTCTVPAHPNGTCTIDTDTVSPVSPNSHGSRHNSIDSDDDVDDEDQLCDDDGESQVCHLKRKRSHSHSRKAADEKQLHDDEVAIAKDVKYIGKKTLDIFEDELGGIASYFTGHDDDDHDSNGDKNNHDKYRNDDSDSNSDSNSDKGSHRRHHEL